MAQGVSEEAQRKALRRLWISTDVIAETDELADFLEDFREEAMALPAEIARSAYRIGRGFVEDGEVTSDLERDDGYLDADKQPAIVKDSDNTTRGIAETPADCRLPTIWLWQRQTNSVRNPWVRCSIGPDTIRTIARSYRINETIRSLSSSTLSRSTSYLRRRVNHVTPQSFQHRTAKLSYRTSQPPNTPQRIVILLDWLQVPRNLLRLRRRRNHPRIIRKIYDTTKPLTFGNTTILRVSDYARAGKRA